MRLKTRELFAFGHRHRADADARPTDVLIDPFIGAWSDRTPAKWGRRGLWIGVGLPVMAVSTVAVFDRRD